MKTRIVFMVALVCIAAGCSNPPQENSNAVSTLAGSQSSFLAAGQSEIKDDSSISFDYKGTPAILLSVNGKYYAYVNKCSLEGCKMAYKDGKLICPCCGSVFDPTSGEPVSGRAKESLPVLTVSVTDGNIYVSSQ